MPDLAPSLREYAARLLVGTDLTADVAVSVATGTLPASGPAARAVREGWDATDTTGPLTILVSAEGESS